ncbi:MAG: DUF1569 domain-containing protein [Gemmatimonadota bacterium]|jgi:hypothetical protein|nr:DUF1569 domain-containing protein [Gemmatimonadota bacterium]
MQTLHDRGVRAATLVRFAGVPADRMPRWGRMTAPRMVVHCTDALRMATGDLPIRVLPVGRVVGALGIGPLLARHAPFPKGSPTHPTLLARAPAAFDAELARLAAALDAFAATPLPNRWPPHPVLGRLSGRTWGVLAWRHLDHHLRQFGA